jgi:hypothetical protein
MESSTWILLVRRGEEKGKRVGGGGNVSAYRRIGVGACRRVCIDVAKSIGLLLGLEETMNARFNCLRPYAHTPYVSPHADAFLPYADTPLRRHADTFLPTPTRFFSFGSLRYS